VAFGVAPLGAGFKLVDLYLLIATRQLLGTLSGPGLGESEGAGTEQTFKLVAVLG
jgi:hypothetical protein